MDLAPPVEPSEDLLGDVAAAFEQSPALTFEQIRQRTGAAPQFVAAALNRFALLGQVIHDLGSRRYRWRTILPVEASLKQVKIDSPEAEAAKELVRRGTVTVTRDETVSGSRALVGRVEHRDVEAVCDSDGRIARGQCNCSHYYRFNLRAGPCRHILALRRAANGDKPTDNLDQWYRASCTVGERRFPRVLRCRDAILGFRWEVVRPEAGSFAFGVEAGRAARGTSEAVGAADPGHSPGQRHSRNFTCPPAFSRQFSGPEINAGQ